MMFKDIIKKYLVLICLILSVVFIVKATLEYPGGSILDKNSVGFGWSKNFISNLFETKAINGVENQARIWAIIGMAFHSVGYGVFFINMSKKVVLKYFTTIFKCIGVANIILIFLIATPLHDLGVLSIVVTLFGFFIITILMLKTKLHFLKLCCILCLLTYYGFFLFFGFGSIDWSVIMQKVYISSSMLLVLGLEYFTTYEDFMSINSAEKK